jgi:hypothetical protein
VRRLLIVFAVAAMGAAVLPTSAEARSSHRCPALDEPEIDHIRTTVSCRTTNKLARTFASRESCSTEHRCTIRAGARRWTCRYPLTEPDFNTNYHVRCRARHSHRARFRYHAGGVAFP